MFLPTVLLASIIIFVVLRTLPVDPLAMLLAPDATKADAAAMRAAYGLDLPIWQQYLIWLRSAASGDFGNSIATRSPAMQLILDALPATLELVFCALTIGIVVGVGGGLMLFHFRGNRQVAKLGDLLNTVMLATPDFIWALGLILVLGVSLSVLPFIGRIGEGLQVPNVTGFLLIDTLLAGRIDAWISALAHLALPSFALGLHLAPLIARVVRSSLLDVALNDYVTAARLRGLPESRVLLRYILRNALLPTLSLLGVQCAFLFGGTLLIEMIFAFPGLGGLMADSLRSVDLPVIQGVTLIYCLIVLVANLFVDFLSLVLDPRLRK